MQTREERFNRITMRHVDVYDHYRRLQGHASDNDKMVTRERLYLDFSGQDFDAVDKAVQLMTPTHISYARTLIAGQLPNNANDDYITAYMIKKEALFAQIDALAKLPPPVNFSSGRADVRATAAAIRVNAGNLPRPVENVHSSASATSAAQQLSAWRRAR